MRRSWIEVRRCARVDLLMGKPSFGLQKPAVSKVAFVSEYGRVPINPVMIVRSGRKVLVIQKLFVRDPSRIAAVKPAGIKIKRKQLVLVPVAQVEIGLPQIVRAVITLPSDRTYPPSKRNSNGPIAS